MFFLLFLLTFLILLLLIVPWLKGACAIDNEIKKALMANKALRAKQDKEARQSLAEQIEQIINEQIKESEQNNEKN